VKYRAKFRWSCPYGKRIANRWQQFRCLPVNMRLQELFGVVILLD